MSFIEELETFFAGFGISLSKARDKLKGMPLTKKAWNLENCFHYLYFAMISLGSVDVKNVLELGTGFGETTAILSELFPASIVYTLDLPEKDIKYQDGHAWKKKEEENMSQFKQNIGRENIVFIPKNSFFLPSLELPQNFGLIWVDANHEFPAVAWDIMFAYNCLREGGFMFVHDYYINHDKGTQVKDTIDYISSRIKEKVWYLPSNNKCLVTKTLCIRKASG